MFFKAGANKKKLAIFLSFFIFGFFLLFPELIRAQEADVWGEGSAGQVTENSIQEASGLSNTDPRLVAARIIRIFFGFLGIVAVSLIMYAGWLWTTSEGNEEKITQAKGILKSAIIGLLIIISSFALVSLIISKLMEATGGKGGYGPGGGGGALGGRGGASLGSGIIETHYPSRDQKDLPRNTKISVTFKEAIDQASLIKEGKINPEGFFIYKTNDGPEAGLVGDVNAYKTDDSKTYVFKPAEYLGSANEKTWYTVVFTNKIKKANGDLAFVSGETVGYQWSFEVGTYLDLTPPIIESIIPFPGAREPRNVVVQINFNEPVDPTAASGATKDFNNIEVKTAADSRTISGNFYISNQYRTVEFLTEDACGVNSCGQTVYCLPGDKEISALVKAASLLVVGEAGAGFPYDGLVDMADNSLDGNGNGSAQGGEGQSKLPAFNKNSPEPTAQGDDFSWSFSTSDKIDLAGPAISGLYPKIMEKGVGLDVVPSATFNKFLMSSSLTSESIKFSATSGDLNYWLNKINKEMEKETSVMIKHDQFSENSEYYPQFTSNIKDIYQNCFRPCSGVGSDGGQVKGAPSCCDGVPSGDSYCWQ